MPSKKIVQDIVPSERRSIRNIPVDHSFNIPIRTSRRKIPKSTDEIDEDIQDKPQNPIKKQNKSKDGKKGINIFASFVIVFVCIVIIGVALSLLYSKAVVTITPKIMNLQIDGKFTAKKDAVLPDLKYEVLTITDEMYKTVPAIDGPLIQTKAKGTIILYNNYSASAQKLIAGTRLSNSQGLVYRTVSSVSIPGKKMVSGKMLPGSVSVAVIADQAGEKYNLRLADLTGDFKVIAYKGSDKYDGFYGRLKTDVTGGFSGNKKIISPELQKQTVKDLEESLKEKLTQKLKSNIPKGYVLYNNSLIIENKVLDTNSKDANTADIKIRTTISGIMFNSKNILDFIAGSELKKFPSASYDIKGIPELEFKIMNTKDLSLSKGTPVTFSLKGPVSITGTFSEDALKKELKGISLNDSNAVFAKYASISNAYALLTPFWMRSFPNSPEKIIIEYKNE